MCKLFVYAFHRVSDEHSPAYPPMPVKTFDRVIGMLNRRHLVIPQDELLNRGCFESRKSRAVITFDDGYYDFAECALPILQKHKTPAALHVVSDTAASGSMFWTQRLNKVIEAYYNRGLAIDNVSLGKRYVMTRDADVEHCAVEIYLQLLNNPDRSRIVSELENAIDCDINITRMLNWDEIAQLPKDIVSIGSHTKSHRNLSVLSDDEVRDELQESYRAIVEHNGQEAPLSIAYPNGQYTPRVDEIASECGYKLKYTCDGVSNGFNENGIYHRLNLYNREYWKNWVKVWKMIVKVS